MRFIITVVSVMVLAACVNDMQVQQVPLGNNEINHGTGIPELDNNPTNEPYDVPVPSIQNMTKIETREEFHDMVAITNGVRDTASVYASSNLDDDDAERLKGLTFYYDFVNFIEDVVLSEIYVKHSYVVIEYCDKEGVEYGSMLIQTFRDGGNVDVDVDLFIEGYRRAMRDPKEIIVNGNRALKSEVFWDNNLYRGHLCNVYYWIQDGYVVFLSVPTWLLDRYPEETFFDIQRIDIQ